MFKNIVIYYLFTIAFAEVCPPVDVMDVRTLKSLDRLPTHVSPIWYNITIEPQFETRTFSGSVEIYIKFIESSDTIVLHTDRLHFIDDAVSITCSENSNLTISTESNADNNFLTMKLNNVVPQNSLCQLEFSTYSGSLSDEEKSGLYLAKYVESGTEKLFATTHFQKTGARKVFPCFDEPHFKATFDVNLIRNEGYITISNEELIDTITLDNGKFQDVYRETRLMSTYLLAFIVTEYGVTEMKQGQRVFADKTAIKNGDAQFPLDLGVEILSELEKYTEYRYSFSKIDQIAIPDEYFSPGAMENWGLVTYRKSALVYPFEKQITKGLQRTVSIISHEYAHQWFGNLVTCAWWNHLWLNEGFGEYFEYFAPAWVGWDFRDIFIIDAVQGALAQDSVIGINPMNHENATTIIVYQKAASIIRMMSHMITEELFQKSLSFYLKSNQYKSITPTELYQAFEAVIYNENKTNLLGPHKFSEIMTSWDSQSGYPILYVTKTNKISLEQKRFFSDGSKADSSKWIIPLTYVVEDDNETNFSVTTANSWMDKSTMTIDSKSDGWVIFNNQQMGYYRVKYDDENFNRLVMQLISKDHNRIHYLNRGQLIDDSFTFVQIGTMNYNQTLELTKYLVKEKDYVPIAVFLKHILTVYTKLAPENGRDNFKYYMKNLLNGNMLDAVTLVEQETDSMQSEYLRIELINWLCKLGSDECTKHALETFKSDSNISANLQEPIYCGAMRIGDQLDWNLLFEKLKNEEDYDLTRTRIINGLGCSENEIILKNYTQEILNSNNRISLTSGFRSILNAGDFGVQFVLNYTSTDFDKIKSNPEVNTIILELAAKLNSENQEQQFNDVAASNDDFKSLFDDGKAKVKANRDWNKQYGDEIKNWLTHYRTSIENSALLCTGNFYLLIVTAFISILSILH